LETPSSWAQAEVDKAIAAGLVPEPMQTLYTADITRAEFCNLAMNLLCVKRGTTVPSLLSLFGKQINAFAFTDTNDYNILAANALGIVGGRGNGIFDPGGYITRQEAALMLRNTAAVFGVAGGSRNASTFADSGSIAPWAMVGVEFVCAFFDPSSGKTVMGSTGNNCFSPLGSYTREQTYVTLYRLFAAV
jgi:hypothetical protein